MPRVSGTERAGTSSKRRSANSILGSLRGRLIRMSSSSAEESRHFQGMNFHSAPEAFLKAKAKRREDGMEESSRTSEGYFLRNSCFKAKVLSADSLAGNVSCQEEADSGDDCAC